MASKKTTSPLELLVNELDDIAKKISAAEFDGDSRTINRARDKLEEVTKRLFSVATSLDPIRRPSSIFDPSDPNTAGGIVALTLVSQDKHPLSEVPDFYGSGIYAIYYNGDYPAYAKLSKTEHPIYVGKADPVEQSAKDAISQGNKVSARLKEHAKSIGKATSTLKLTDFECRYLVVQTGFQKSAEDYLIGFFKPIWNSETKICFGLGKHGDSADVRVNKRSPWDTLHPGRKWADGTSEDQKEDVLILSEIDNHFIKNKPYCDINEIFRNFISGLKQWV